MQAWRQKGSRRCVSCRGHCWETTEASICPKGWQVGSMGGGALGPREWAGEGHPCLSPPPLLPPHVSDSPSLILAGS